MAAIEKFTLSPIDGPRADLLLEHINLDRWMRGRPGELVRLVAYLSDWPQWAPIRPRDIGAYLERTPRQARYDHEVMVRLTSDRVLQRTARAAGDLWRVNPDLRHWRGVPGVPSWRSVVSLFSANARDNCARSWPNSPGQSVASAPVSPLQDTVEGVPLSATNMAGRARNMARHARRPGKTPAEPGAPRAAGSAAHYVSSITPSSYVDDDDAKRLIKAVRDAIGAPAVYGAPAELLGRVAAEHREQIGRLEELAGELLVGCRAPSRAASILAQAVEDGALDRPGPGLDPLDAKRRSIEAQIRAWESAGADPEDIGKLQSQLEDLGGQ